MMGAQGFGNESFAADKLATSHSSNIANAFTTIGKGMLSK
jgi:hypothetical protein